MTMADVVSALAERTGIPFALDGWQTNPDAEAWGSVIRRGEAGAIWGDDEQQEQALRGYVSVFARRECGIQDTVQNAIRTLDLSWRYETEDYEPDTRLWHYTWSIACWR